MGDPRLALKLYVAILVVALMFSRRGTAIRSYLSTTKQAAASK